MRSEATEKFPTRTLRCTPATAVALVIALFLCGCRAASISESVASKFGGNDPEAQIEFWHALGEKPIACNDDAFHGLLIYVDGEDQSNSYAARVDTLKSRGLLPARFDAPATQAIDRGTLAVAIAKALKIRGGLMMRATGTAPRYAVRELVYEGVYPPSSPNQTFSGAEFLGVMGKMEDWQRGNVEVPAAVLPGEAGSGGGG
ncbi:hypothetical protein BH09PLA1_BH09PLA1_27640 [soil metagenome]